MTPIPTRPRRLEEPKSLHAAGRPIIDISAAAS
jgi:hypothetical protein